MQHAIATLQAQLLTSLENARTFRKAGESDQAKLADATAADCKAAIKALGNSDAVPDQRVMRSKMKVISVLRDESGELLKMVPVCRDGGYPSDGSDEDNSFALFSPSGSLELRVTNPALKGVFDPSQKVYLDFTRADS
jgi:hypothetical protein